MKDVYKIVLIGCGYMGRSHLEGIQNNPRIQLSGVVDTDIEKAKQTAQEFHVTNWSDNYYDFVDNSKVDIAIICTYPNTHFEIAKSFMDCGIHVICEKPISNNLKDAKKFFDYAMHSKAKIIFGHILRYNTTYLEVYKMIREGAIGSPLVFRLSQLKYVGDNKETFANLLNSSSPIIDCGVHYFDIMRWFTGSDAVSFSGIGQCLDSDIASNTYNYGIVTIQFNDGSVGYYESGWSKSLANDSTKEFIGPKGRIKIIYQNQRTENKEKGNLIIYQNNESGTTVQIDVEYDGKPVNNQLNHFIEMIEQDIDHRPFLEDVYRAMQEVTLAHRAICENRTFYTLDGYKKIQWDPSCVL